ncbi:MAG: hypothetical protein K2Y56_05270 [Methylobacterium sp.]|uniref:hypothetical protein n=1 Tax=Methylobacterium sp. TaxID=409 RepID=UPI0025D47D4F|nr:hypothetical protein [Methylobacterium sp.]MBX9930933.1 hypothetical protein [Methylobacterium sp.]
MIDRLLLDRAVARGIVTESQALALLDLGQEPALKLADPPNDDERLRFVSGFADIFVTIGLLLFLGTSAYIASETIGDAFGSALVAAMSWGLAEFFTRRRRMALPSIVLLVAFATASFSAVVFLFAGAKAVGIPPFGIVAPNLDAPLPVAAAALGTLGLVALHYRRFQVPITIAAGTAALAGTLVALVFALAPDFAERSQNGLLIVAGLAIFAFAMRYDISDPERTSRATDTAFWLHLLAAPLIVHPVLSAMTAGSGGFTGSAAAGLVLAVVLVLALVALVTDRRAILVAGMTYTVIAFGTLIRDLGYANRSLPLSLLALGAFVLLLSAGWHPLRGLILRALPRGLAARLPHPVGTR